MPQKTELSQFLDELHDDVKSRIPEDADTDSAGVAAFTEYIAEELAEYGAVENLIPCLLDESTGKGRLISNGYYLTEDCDRLDLFVTHYRQAEDGDTLTKTEIRQSFDRGKRILQLIDGGWDTEAAEGTEQDVMISAIRDAAAKIREVRVIVLSDCAAKDTNDLKEDFEGRQARCVIWDVERLFRVRKSGRAYEAIEIQLSEYHAEPIPVLAMPENDSGYRTYLTFLPGDLLYRLYDEHGARLLQLNVRSFLQARGKVNKGIRNTIINEPKSFLAYNNGLTATIESIECTTDSSGQLILNKLVGFQVVNGGQTVASIHQTAKKDKAPLTDVLVQAKISSVADELMGDLVSKISRYSNTQNRVNEADFSANDPLHVQIEELSERIWVPGEASRWFYERARGQYQVAKSRYGTTPARTKKFGQQTPTSQKFAKTDLAKYINTWGQKPDLVSRGAQKNFTAMMDALSNNSSGPEIDDEWYKDLIGKAIIFKAAESIARKLKLPAYRANAITYTVAILSYKTRQRIDLGAIWDNQTVSDVLRETITAWMPQVHAELIASAKGRNVTEWCKKQDCWRHIQTMGLEVPANLEQELAKGQALPNVGKDGKKANLELTPEDRDNLALVMMVPDTVWLEIHKWGNKDGNLQPLQYGIALTLASYAAGEWTKIPSRKQASHGAEIIGKARPHLTSLAAILGDVRDTTS